MIAHTIIWNSIRDDILADPEVKEEYDRLTPEFEFARMEFGKRTPNFSQVKLITTGLIPIHENQEEKI